MSVYDRMLNDEKLFWLGYGVLYITEMRRVKGVGATELRVKSKGLAEKWFALFEKYGVLPRTNQGIHEYKGIYAFGATVQSLYRLIHFVGRIPDSEMDSGIRERISKISTAGNSEISSTRIKILKALRNGALSTNELARQIRFSSGGKLKYHLESLSNLGMVKSNSFGKQNISNSLTEKGLQFVNCFENRIEKAPTDSLYDECFTNKQLTSDLLLIACELEMGGILQRQPYLQMKSKDFVEFALSIAKKWGWTNYGVVVEVNRHDWNTTYLVGFNSKFGKEVYPLSGPCADQQKDAHFRHAFNLNKPGQHRKIGQTKDEILCIIEKNSCNAKDLALNLNIGIQNIQRFLSALTKSGQVKRQWKDRGYYYTKTPIIADAKQHTL